MNRIKDLRLSKGLSQIDLAKAINVHQTAISQWETDKTNPDMSSALLLADYFDVTTDYLLGRIDEFLSNDVQESFNRVKELRESNGIKQIDLAKELNISQGTLSNWERGVHDPDNISLIKLSEIFNVSLDYLLGKTNFPNQTESEKENKSGNIKVQMKSGEDFKDLNKLPEEAQRQIKEYYEFMVMKHLGRGDEK